MKSNEMKSIQLLVKDEQDLYTPFSPENELSESVKTYIRSKVAGIGYNQKMKLTVISSFPLDEEKFRSAIKNWIEDEKASFRQAGKRSSHLQASLFITGFLIVILDAFLKQHIDSLTYAVILIIGTAAMGRGVALWYEQVAPKKATKWLINEMEKQNTIVFEHTSQIS